MGQPQDVADSVRMRVLSIPAAHPYVVQALPAAAIEMLPDATDPWWPPVAFDPLWMADHGRHADLVHVHFGFDHVPPGVLAEWCDVVAGLRLPLVVTVHDLRNPHLVDNETHLSQLGVLVERADVLITLTAGAAREIQRRFRRQATVVPHPNLVPDDIASSIRATARRRGGVVGVEFGIGRANVVDPALILPPIAEAVADAGGSLLVGVRRDSYVLADRIRRVVASLGPSAPVDVLADDHLDDDELYSRVAQRQVMVLPYRFGTHSGWLELCRDLGTRVVAPSCGHYADQWHDIHTFGCDERDGLNVDELRSAVGAALVSRAPRLPSEWRHRQREHGRMIHERLYRRAAATVRMRASSSQVAS